VHKHAPTTPAVRVEVTIGRGRATVTVVNAPPDSGTGGPGPTDLINAVRTAARGEPVLAPQVLRDLVDRHLGRPGSGDTSRAARRRIATLSDTELKVLRVVADGAANPDIARQLYMSTGTVKAHISRILTKLDCENRVQAAIVAHESGVLREPEVPS
jgi:DNA-binding NarL/FixJ family response regulator